MYDITARAKQGYLQEPNSPLNSVQPTLQFVTYSFSTQLITGLCSTKKEKESPSCSQLNPHLHDQAEADVRGEIAIFHSAVNLCK